MKQPIKVKKQPEWKVGDKAKVLVGGKYRFIGEIIHIQDGIATVAVPVYFGSCVEYIPAESKLDDLWCIINGIGDLDIR